MNDLMATAVETPAVDAEITADTTAAGADPILVLREQIDAIDTAIVRLVAERARLSERVQTTRVNSGGARLQLGREREILQSYRAGLGPKGPELADAVLQFCRGAR
jgi:chorismate mutase